MVSLSKDTILGHTVKYMYACPGRIVVMYLTKATFYISYVASGLGYCFVKTLPITYQLSILMENGILAWNCSPTLLWSIHGLANT